MLFCTSTLLIFRKLLKMEESDKIRMTSNEETDNQFQDDLEKILSLIDTDLNVTGGSLSKHTIGNRPHSSYNFHKFSKLSKTKSQSYTNLW